MDFFFQNDSVENSLICPRTKSASHCLTELFQIYQNKHWTIRRRDDHIVVPSSNRIKSKVDWIYVKTLERIVTDLLQQFQSKYPMTLEFFRKYVWYLLNKMFQIPSIFFTVLLMVEIMVSPHQRVHPWA